MTLQAQKGIGIRGMAVAWPEDLLGSAATMSDDDVYAAILGEDWHKQLLQRQWDFNRPHAEWGVKRRGWTRGSNVGSVELALAAAEKALADAGLKASDVDCIIAATCSPNHITSTIAGKLAKRLQTTAAAIDVRAGGAGGLNALATAALYHTAGCRVSLVVAAEVSSKYLGEHDLSNALLFGDGAAAVVLVSEPGSDAGLVGAVLGNDDWQGTAFTVPGELPPMPNSPKESYYFQKPDAVYRQCLSDSWVSAGVALREAFPQKTLAAVLPYAVTREQVNQCVAGFAAGEETDIKQLGSASIGMLADRGCIGCASPLAAVVLHWQKQRRDGGAVKGEVVASLAVAGGISWAGLLWQT